MAFELETPPQGQGAEQVKALTSYLYRLSQQLQWAFETLESGENAQSLQAVPRNQMDQTRQEDPQKVFAGLKNLIIKSADIVNAYSEQISRKLSSSYVSKSQFGTYAEKSSQEITANAGSITQLFERSEQITRQVQDFAALDRASKAYLRSGLLMDGPPPVYGLEVGQTMDENGRQVFRKYARFTADRLSFFNASDMEVAYISDYRLYITCAQVAGPLELGSRFSVFTDQGLIFKWTGGSQ